MKILCPKCQMENNTENAVSGAIQCVSCAEWFKEPLAPEQARKFTVDAKALRPVVPLRINQTARIKQQAESFAAVAIICFLLGMVILIAAVVNSSMWGTACGGGLLSLALWLYLVAQIIHIRANTEK